jgi:cytochrome c peroxidase
MIIAKILIASRHIKTCISLLIAAVTIISCRKDPRIEAYDEDLEDDNIEVASEPLLPAEPYNYEARIFPAYFLADPLLNLLNTLNDGNQVTNEGATLGRVLFYDKNLSVNNTISCASCHHQENGFTDTQQFSDGFDGGLSERNSMSIVNINFERRFFWDTRASSIEQQVLMPIEHPLEMGMNLDDLVERIQQISYYEPLLIEAFGDSLVTLSRLARALGQFLKSIRSYESKYDQGMSNDFADFNAIELAGKDLFMSGVHSCINCHHTVNFGGVSSNINGLDAVSADPGIGGITGDEEDYGKFKTVTLRNIELTAPYMHDGRFATLDDVLNFYSTEIQPHPFLDDRLASDFSVGGPPKDLNLTTEQKTQYIAFLKTLTDWNLIANPIYSNPFEE